MSERNVADGRCSNLSLHIVHYTNKSFAIGTLNQVHPYLLASE